MCWVTNELSASIYSVKIGHIWRVPVLLKWFLLRSTNKLLVLETLRSRFGHFTANVKLRFAVNGFTLPVCPYFGLTAVTINTRLRRVFSCLFKPKFSWTSINCFHGFPRALTEKVPSSLNEGRIISNDDGFLNYFIKMKDYIVKTTRSLRAEWNSRNILHSLRNGFQVVYLFDVWKHGSRGRLNCQEAKLV